MGSIKRSCIFEKVISILKENQISYWELLDVEPNPRIITVKKGVEICREATNNFLEYGKQSKSSVQPIGHELSACYSKGQGRNF